MVTDHIVKLRDAREVLKEMSFETRELQRGYANRVLRIDITKNTVEFLPVTEEMKNLWTGGRGFDLWLMFKEINRNTKWDSPENPICFSGGPLGGTISFPGSGKTLVTTISPLTDSVMDCNVGGYFGPYFKFLGFDALCIVGKADDYIIIVIDGVNNKISIEKAPLESNDSHVISEELTSMYADNELDMRNIAVVSSGRAAEYARMGILNFSFWDWRRGIARMKQAGRGGIGTVFRNKKMKALVVKSLPLNPAWRVVESKMAKTFTDNICTSHCKTDRERICKIIDKWNSNPEYILEMMQDIQKMERYISKTAIDEICKKTGMSKGQLYHIATFYKDFTLKPAGEKVIQVCFGTACHVKGASKLLETLEKELGIKNGETTSDEKFTLEAVPCLGYCSIAPVIKIGEEIIGNVRLKDVSKIISERRGK
ncbi:MAG TPA: aldehyde ferredoxin oxidoreductase N-terminal domain-containing protein [Candidatus Eremiobacteraeota bacterium]|nr:MAG: NADP-reducing hydrogenase subunit HndA [bacterium ADurb.Bin363]HPZ08032.1 aldehyde ferredoxin oxidoreductase N-terminal domain-containing protein [Candidatus Eremiobacteraeota bacterium]